MSKMLYWVSMFFAVCVCLYMIKENRNYSRENLSLKNEVYRAKEVSKETLQTLAVIQKQIAVMEGQNEKRVSAEMVLKKKADKYLDLSKMLADNYDRLPDDVSKKFKQIWDSK